MRAPLIFTPILLLLWFTAAAAFGASENDIKLIIDVSGSMKKNDPDNLRRPAVNLLMNLLPEDATAAVWLFGDKVEPLVPFGAATAEFKTFAMSQSKLIHSRGLLTDIGGALERAMLQDHRGGKAILLSDGMVDLGPDPALNVGEQARIQHRLIPQLIASNAEVHTVALSDNADRKILEAVAQGTGGLFEVAKTADDLTRIFLRLFDDAVIQDRLPIERGQFLVDSTVEEFTLLAFSNTDSAAVQIRSPDDQYFLAGDHPEGVRWYQDAGFDLITVSKPIEGEWRLFSDEDPQNRVTVLSDLKLDVTNLENVLHEASFPILEVRFLQGLDVITEASFLSLMDLQLIVVTPSGKRIAKPLGESEEGVFTSDLAVFAEPGRYSVNVSVDGKSFRREVVQEVEYVSPARVVFSATERLVRVRPVAVGLLGKDLRMIARLEDDQDKKRLLPMLSNGELWQVSLQDVPDGEYKLTIHVKGIAKTGQPLDFDLEHQPIELSSLATSESTAALASEAQSFKDWNLKDWAIAAAVAGINLALLLFIVWLVKRRGQGTLLDEDEADVADLLTQVPEAGLMNKSGPTDKSDKSDKSDKIEKGGETDLIAVLEEAEALREKDGEPPHEALAEEIVETEVETEVKSEAKSEAKSEVEAKVETEVVVESKTDPESDTPVSVEPEAAPQPAATNAIDDFSDIVDAWGESSADPASDALADPSAADSSDADLMDEFQRALSDQLQDENLTNNSDEPEDEAAESIDKKSETGIRD